MSSACPNCQFALRPEDRFCPACGASAPGQPPGRPTPSKGTEEPPRDPLLERVRKAALGLFEIRARLGRGGMAAVYLAHDIRLNKKVALKVMLPELFLSEGMAERFKAEARTSARLYHPNIIIIHSMQELDDLLFFVMNLVEGAPLDAILRYERQLPVPVIQSVLLHVASALSYANDEGVVHRDMKPSNVMINIRGDAVVTDFGIAKVLADPQSTSASLTLGTPTYMSPEQVRGTTISSASDQYSFGVMAYEMFAGAPPFSGIMAEVQMAHLGRMPEPLSVLRPDVDPAICDAVMRMLAKLPQDRFATLSDIVPILSHGFNPYDAAPRAHLAALARKCLPLTPEEYGVTPRSPIPTARGARIMGGAGLDSGGGGSSGKTVISRIPIGDELRSGAQPVAGTVGTAAESAIEIEVGEVASLMAAGEGQRTVAPASAVEWQSSDPKVVTVSTDGQLLGVGAGTARVDARVMGETSSVDVVVRPAAPALVRFIEPPESVRASEEAVLSAEVVSAHGVRFDDRAMSWQSSDEAIATVDRNGRLSAKIPGFVTITVEHEGRLAAVSVTVEPARVAALRFASPSETVPAGETLLLVPQAEDARGNTLLDRRVEWTSADPGVASVDGAGRVSAHREGNVNIRASCEGTEAILPLVVSKAPVESLTLEPRDLVVDVGEETELRATARDRRGNELSSWSMSWKSSNRAIATVSPAGVVRALKAGSVSVSVECGGEKAASAVRVIAPARVAEAIEPVAAEVRAAAVAEAAASPAAPRYREEVVEAPERDRAAGGTGRRGLLIGVASVVVVAGALTMWKVFGKKSEGTAEVVAPPPDARIRVDSQLARADSSRTSPPPRNQAKQVPAATPKKVDTPPVTPSAAIATVPGEDLRASRVIISSGDRSQLEAGDTLRLGVTVTDGRNRLVDRAAVAWSSADPGVAEADASGRVVLKQPGRTRIAAEFQGKRDEISLVVNARSVRSLEFTVEPADPVVGARAVGHARALDARQAVIDGVPVTYRSDNADVATVSASGEVTARSAGTATITATAGAVSRSAVVRPRAAVVAPAPRGGDAPAVTPARLAEPDARRAVEAEVAGRIQRKDLAGLNAISGGSANERRLLDWLRQRDRNYLSVGAPTGVQLTPQAGGGTLVSFSVTVKWRGTIGNDLTENAALSAIVEGAGAAARVTRWSVTSPFPK